MTSTEVFSALSDETRRSVLSLTAERDGATATRLAAELGVSRQAIAKHLSILETAGLVRSEKRGRERLYTAEREPLELAAKYLLRLGALWDQRMAGLRDVVSDDGIE